MFHLVDTSTVLPFLFIAVSIENLVERQFLVGTSVRVKQSNVEEGLLIVLPETVDANIGARHHRCWQIGRAHV